MHTPNSEFSLSEPHEQWLANNDAQIRPDNDTLHSWADALGAPLHPEADIHVSPWISPHHDKALLNVTWQVTEAPLRLPDHQTELTQAVGVSLLTLKHEVQRRLVNVRGGIAFLTGTLAVGVGDVLMHNDALRYGGGAVALASIVTIAAVNTRNTPKPGDVALPPQPPLVIERTQ